MAAWIITTMAVEDIEEVVAIEHTLFTNPWSHLSYESELTCDNAYTFIVRPRAYQAGKQPIVAYAALRMLLDEIHLLRVGVAIPWQRLGIAFFLMKECMRRAALAGALNAFLEVRASNGRAIDLYKKLGFQLIGKRPNYYPDTHEDALMMIKNLKEEHNER